MKRSARNLFNTVKMMNPQSSFFDLTHQHKFSARMGYLTPTLCEEALPGDTFRITSENLIRFAPMLSPVMHSVRVKTHYFFVPNRLLWSNWDPFITDKETHQAPYVTLPIGSNYAIGSLQDFLGLPAGENAGDNVRISPMAQAAYRLIYDEYYRDQNLQDPIFVPLVNGDNDADYLASEDLQRRCWEHDYFTACALTAQKGSPVQMPLVTQNDIPVEFQQGHNPIMRKPGTGVADSDGDLRSEGGQLWNVDEDAPTALDPNGSLVVDVQAGATDLETLRTAWKLQGYLERLMRGGSRFTEWLRSMFGVVSPDARLQRPEFIGSISQNIVFSEVLATANNVDTETPVGMMSGHGISVGGGDVFKYHAYEHGFILGIMSVLPDTAYQQGVPRGFTRFDPLDYALPVFANLGEQAVKIKELFVGAPDPEVVFGYNPRFSEYKFRNSRISGFFRTNLSTFHLGRIFQTAPVLDENFVAADPSTRIFAVTDLGEDHLFCRVVNRVGVTRKLPYFGTPTVI